MDGPLTYKNNVIFTAQDHRGLWNASGSDRAPGGFYLTTFGPTEQSAIDKAIVIIDRKINEVRPN
jgi:hypothetical protein